jgi:hypothetical protein
VASVPALRWVAAVTVAIALGFYAQFESGLPAFALMFLDLPEQTIGTAAAVNCLVIVALQMVVVRWTARSNSASLLVAVGLIWVLSWGVLAFLMSTPGFAAVLFVTTFGIFAVGETLFAPVLNPLTASLAPPGMVGTTLGLFAGLQTGVSAVGPLLAGLALGAGHGMTFVVVHLVISVPRRPRRAAVAERAAAAAKRAAIDGSARRDDGRSAPPGRGRRRRAAGRGQRGQRGWCGWCGRRGRRLTGAQPSTRGRILWRVASVGQGRVPRVVGSPWVCPVHRQDMAKGIDRAGGRHEGSRRAPFRHLRRPRSGLAGNGRLRRRALALSSHHRWPISKEKHR